MYLVIWVAAVLGVAISFRNDSGRTKTSLKKTLGSLKFLLPGVLAMIALVGLALAAIPQDQLMRLFAQEGIAGLSLVSLVGAIVTIPAPIAFPLAGALLKMGAPAAMLASFITTLTMVGIVTAPLESSFFGVRFTVLRQSLSFIAAVVIGVLMGVLL